MLPSPTYVPEVPLPLPTSNVAIGALGDLPAQEVGKKNSLIALFTRLVFLLLPASLGPKPKAESLAITFPTDPDPLPVVVEDLPLPDGAATEATQLDVLDVLDNIYARQADKAQQTRLTDGTNPIGTASVPIRIDPTGTTAQPVSDNGGSLTVDGNVGVNNGAGVAAVNIQDGGNSITVDGSVAVSNFPATQPISAVALPLPAGAAEQATLASVLAKLNATLAVTQSGTWTITLPANAATETTLAAILAKLNATVAVTQSGTWVISLPANAATETTVAAILAKLNASIAVTGAFWQATQPISAAALPLPAGASTEATLLAAKVDLDTMVARTNTLGQKTMAASMPVVLASDQSAIPVTGTVVPDTSTLDQHRAYGIYTIAVTTADQLIFTYTVPVGKTFYLLGYYVENDNTGGLVKIGVNAMAEASGTPGATTTDGNIFRGLQLQNFSATAASSEQNEDFSGFPRKLGVAGDVVKMLVKQSNSGSTTWRTSMDFYLK